MGFKVGDIVKHADWPELGIVLEIAEAYFSKDLYVIVQWAGGRRGYWGVATAHKYLWVIC